MGREEGGKVMSRDDSKGRDKGTERRRHARGKRQRTGKMTTGKGWKERGKGQRQETKARDGGMKTWKEGK